MKTIISVIMYHSILKSEFSLVKRIYTRIFTNFADYNTFYCKYNEIVYM